MQYPSSHHNLLWRPSVTSYHALRDNARLWKPTAVATCGHTKITADICSNLLLALTQIQSLGSSVTASINWSHQVTLRGSQPTPNVPWTQAGWPVVTDGLCRYRGPVWQSLSFAVCGDSSEPPIARGRWRTGRKGVKRMMSRRYSARQQSNHSPGGIGHISHKLRTWEPSWEAAYRDSFDCLWPSLHPYQVWPDGAKCFAVKLSGIAPFQKPEVNSSTNILRKAICA